MKGGVLISLDLRSWLAPVSSASVFHQICILVQATRIRSTISHCMDGYHHQHQTHSLISKAESISFLGNQKLRWVNLCASHETKSSSQFEQLESSALLRRSSVEGSTEQALILAPYMVDNASETFPKLHPQYKTWSFCLITPQKAQMGIDLLMGNLVSYEWTLHM